MHAAQLHVVGVYNNPRRYDSRKRLLRQWIERTLAAGVSVTVVEHAFGERPLELTADSYPSINLVQVRGGPEHELWLKEPLINLGVSSIMQRYPDTRYLCWEDTDVEHVRPDWPIETLHMLQHNRVGQTWSQSVDLTPDCDCATNEWGRDVDRSFSSAWLAGDLDVVCDGYGQPVSRSLRVAGRVRDTRQHYGYSWAIRVDALKGIGRLLDWLIVGSGDFFMALGFAGLLPAWLDDATSDRRDGTLSPGYVRRLREFAQRCETNIRQDIGGVPGLLLHHWHGRKRDRFYIDRKHILAESGFDPDVDITFDAHGLPMLSTDNRLLRDGLRRYNMQRNEDSVDVE